MSRLRAFDPDAHISRQPSAKSREPMPAGPAVPDEWRAGIEMLRDMHMPDTAKPDRWSQIVEDAAAFTLRCHGMSAAAGWTTGNIFGFDYDQPNGFIGLIFEIRGGRVVAMNPKYASIWTGEKHVWRYRLMPDDAPPVWRLRRSR